MLSLEKEGLYVRAKVAKDLRRETSSKGGALLQFWDMTVQVPRESEW